MRQTCSKRNVVIDHLVAKAELQHRRGKGGEEENSPSGLDGNGRAPSPRCRSVSDCGGGGFTPPGNVPAQSAGSLPASEMTGRFNSVQILLTVMKRRRQWRSMARLVAAAVAAATHSEPWLLHSEKATGAEPLPSVRLQPRRLNPS